MLNDNATKLTNSAISDTDKKTAAQAFGDAINALIDFAQTAPKVNTDGGLSSTLGQELETVKKQQLKFGFLNPGNSMISYDDFAANIVYNADARLIAINNLAVRGGYKNGKFFAGDEPGAPLVKLPNLLVSLFVNNTEEKAIDTTYASATPPTPTSGRYNGHINLFTNALKNE